MRRYVVAGGTGLVGSALCQALQARGDEVTIFEVSGRLLASKRTIGAVRITPLLYRAEILARRGQIEEVNALFDQQFPFVAKSTGGCGQAVFLSLKADVWKEIGRIDLAVMDYTTAIDVNPNYITPKMLQFRLQKIMDEYVGGISVNYMTNEPLLTRGLELLGMLKEDVAKLGAEDLHQLQRAWELQHRLLASECVTQHTLFRKETRWPGYYYRGDYPKLDDENWHCFTLSSYDRDSGKWTMEKAPVYHIVK